MTNLELIKGLRGIVVINADKQAEIKGGQGDPPPYPDPPPTGDQ